MTDQLPTDATPQQPVTSTDATPPTTVTPGTESVIVPASAVTASATVTPVVTVKKFLFNLPETLIVVLIVVSLIHFGLQHKPDKPVKVQESKKVTVSVNTQKGTTTETIAKPITKSKAEVKATKKQKRNDHSFSGPMGH